MTAPWQRRSQTAATTLPIGPSWHNATLDSSGTSVLSTWRVSTTLAPGFVTLQARATAP
ncbi:MAG: hypothetical protein NTW21_21955 [Verrucomicrobia bacterium]|nr:hypothetical protein [Verrucomicrobiota bacterium]